MLVFLEIGDECAAKTRQVLQLGVFDAPLFRWPPLSSLCTVPRLPCLGSATLLPSRPVQLSHRKLTSLAHVNISLGLFLEVQEGKIVFLRLQSQAENNEDGIRETVEEPLMNIYYLHSTHE